jgi:hypothetical protein
MPPAAGFVLSGDANGSPAFDRALMFTHAAADAFVDINKGSLQADGYAELISGAGWRAPGRIWG